MAVVSSSWTSSSDLDSPRSGASRSPGASPSSSGSPSIVAADTNDESHLGFLAFIFNALGSRSPNISAAVGDAGDDEQSIGGASDAMCDTYEMYRDDIRRRHRV